MKNVFGIDITNPYAQRTFDGDCFLTRSLSDELSQRLHNVTQMASESADEPAANPWLLGGCIGTGFIGVCAVMGALNALEYEHVGSPVALFIIAVVMFAVCVVIYRFMRRDINRRKKSDTANELRRMRDEAVMLAHKELKIPASAQVIDLLTQMYLVEKNGKIKPAAIGTSYINAAHYCYLSGTSLCIATNYSVYEIPMSSVKDVSLEKKKATFPNWNKEERWGTKAYRKYKISYSEGRYYAKYYRVGICDVKGEFELLIPNYDFERFSLVTGIKASV